MVMRRRYDSTMHDAADAPDPELVYLNYPETCRRLGIEPVPRRARIRLDREWTDALTTHRAPPPRH